MVNPKLVVLWIGIILIGVGVFIIVSTIGLIPGFYPTRILGMDSLLLGFLLIGGGALTIYLDWKVLGLQ